MAAIALASGCGSDEPAPTPSTPAVVEPAPADTATDAAPAETTPAVETAEPQETSDDATDPASSTPPGGAIGRVMAGEEYVVGTDDPRDLLVLHCCLLEWGRTRGAS